MPDNDRHSIIPDVPMYGSVHSPDKKAPHAAAAKAQRSPEVKGKRAPETKGAVVTDIDSLIEPPSGAPVREKFTVANISDAVKSTNIPMVLMIFVILVFGLIILYSVSGPDAYGQFQDSSWFLVRQVRYSIVGVILMFIVAFIPVNFFNQKWVMVGAYIFSIGFSIATLLSGVGRENGAVRWINIGPIQFQSSEFIKVALVVAFAGYRSTIAKVRSSGKVKEPDTEMGRVLANATVDFIIPVVFCILVDFVILLQPHLSCFIIIAAVIFMCALVSEIPLKSWLAGSLIIAVVGGTVGGIILAVTPAETKERYLKNYAHVFKRIAIFTADEEELDDETSGLTRDDTRQVDNAHNALGSGGMWGVGLGNSRSKYNYVSEAQNDYIFSIYIEETGFVGGVVLMSMYLIMFFMCLAVCWRAKDVFSRTVATGCTALIFVEVLMNLSVELQIIPATGVTLPFISCGGTAQVSLLIAYGLILSVSRTGSVPKEKKRLFASKKALKPGA